MAIQQIPGGLFGGGSQAPALSQLAQMLQQLPQQKQAQAPGINTPNEEQAAPSQMPAQPTVGANPLGSSIQGWLGGLMGGSGASGGANSLNQGLSFAAAPTGAVGPFAASSPLAALGAGTGVAAGGAGAGGLSSLASLAPMLMALL